ncbi:hypothetical protein [Eubacterium aggregans]|uniref:hypothetical protein n=1 Tax=Eubacterium aggregans TaxID=81409 RepID=UPI003F30C388
MMRPLRILGEKRPSFEKNEAGYVLVLVLVILALVMGTGVILLTRMQVDLKDDIAYQEYQHCIFLGKSAAEECRWALVTDPNYQGTDGLQSGEEGSTYRILVQQNSETQRGFILECRYGRYQHYYTGIAEIDRNTCQINNFLLQLKY